MINDKDIIFITSSLMTKWTNIQSKLIKIHFPESNHIIINGSTDQFRNNWPNSWFYFLYILKESEQKYYIHIDEDFFLDSREEVLKVLNKMEMNNINIMGISDGYNHYRSANPVAMNAFLLIGKIDDIKKIDLDKLMKSNYRFVKINEYFTWSNDLDIKYKEEYNIGFDYRFSKNGGSNYLVEQEPYYSFLWTLKEMGCKFDYLYPHFDDRFKSTNPRLEEDSEDIGYHMWYTRNWDSNMDVWGMKNIDRYNQIEIFIKQKYKLK